MITRDDVEKLQQAMSVLPQAELKTRHYWADGMYCRELFRPAGTVIVGKVHKKEHFYIVLSGEVTVSGEGYGERIKAPRIMVSKPGTKRAVYAHVDSICITIHRTEYKELKQIEAELIEHDPTALFDASNKVSFDVPAFRELTQKIINAEKVGFWSDWSKEQQEAYKKGQWKVFSRSRGYSEEEIADYQRWLDMVRDALNMGINPHSYTIDMTTKAALANIKRTSLEEILKSSHAPFEDRS
jgi:hypothetical protein